MRERRNCTSYISSLKTVQGKTLTDVTSQYAGKTVTIKSVENNMYLCADTKLNSNSPLCANKNNALVWETFSFTDITSDGWIGIRAYNGRLITANLNKNNAPLEADSNNLLSWECYRVYSDGTNQYLLCQANNKWLCVRTDTENAPCQAYAANASTWERLQINMNLNWRWPVDNAQVKSTSNNWSEYYKVKNGDHLGVDLTSKTGDTKIYACSSGNVVLAGWNNANGNTVVIEHNYNGQTIYSFYAHLSSIKVNVGDKVTTDTQIAVMGSTTGNGSSTGVHLHFALTTMKSKGTYGYSTGEGQWDDSSTQYTYKGYVFYNPYTIIGNLPS